MKRERKPWKPQTRQEFWTVAAAVVAIWVAVNVVLPWATSGLSLAAHTAIAFGLLAVAVALLIRRRRKLAGH
jgi:hypothetical protein